MFNYLFMHLKTIIYKTTIDNVKHIDKNSAIDINLTTLLINNVVSKYQTNLQVNYTTIINNI